MKKYILLLLSIFPGSLHAAEPPADARMGWWREARFGMFIHWGVYSMTGGEHDGKRTWTGGEWVQNGLEIPVAEYKKLPAGFNPVSFDAKEWVAIARSAGMKYIVITAKHHDGFAMFKSEASPFNIVDATPFKRDVLRELADACREAKMPLGFYYSQAQDWTHPGGSAARINNRKTGHWDPAQDGSMDEYIDKIAVPQVRELLSNYGEFPSVLWWDTPIDMNKERAAKLDAAVRGIKPDIITNNRLGGGFEGDTETPEQHIPPQGYPGRDWETCMTMNGTWGYKHWDHDWKSDETLIRNLCDIASKGGNYLLNVGPDGLGEIPAPSVRSLAAMGEWMKVNGESIYGTGPTAFGPECGTFHPEKKDKEGKPVFEAKWDWRCTTKPGKIYIHLFQWPAGGFTLDGVKGRVSQAYLLAARDQKLAVGQEGSKVLVSLPANAPDSRASVLCLEVSNPIVPPAEIAAGPFKPTDESLAAYQCPDWFRDAKFGIWSHWGPQAVPRQGDWYAKGMYEHGAADGEGGARLKQNRYNKHHLEHYGHPSKSGYKDIIPLWRAERLDPDALMALYKKTGAKYFVSMGTHHDNFFLWDSKIHRWNSVKMGPMKDVVGLYQQAARKQGMKFGVSEHLGASFTWFRTAHGTDADGPMKGVPYDGNDPQNQDLYHQPRAAGDDQWLTKNPADQRRWFESIKELLDLYQPDLLYSDSPMPFGDVGRSMIAHFYNSNAGRNGGRVEAVYNCKEDAKGKWVRDIERGVADGIRPEPWQTDTSIGDWYYRTGQKYMTSGEVVRMLADIVSKNGNLLLNVVQTPEGDLEPDVLAILDGIGRWISINGEGIYGTRPWQVFGEGPAIASQEKGHWGGLKDVPSKPFTAGDFRFTTSKDGTALYAFCFGMPEKEFRIVSLGGDSKLSDRSIATVEILGSAEKVAWKQEAGALVVTKPAGIPDSEAVGIKVTFKP